MMSKKFIQDLSCGKIDCFHAAEMAHSLHQQWLNGECCDLKVMVEDRCYNVHKCVISCFSAKFCDKMEKLEMIRLVGVTKFGFEKILEFMYKGKMTKLTTLDLHEFQEIMKAADVLNSSKVVRYCTQERNDLIQTLNRDYSSDAAMSYGGTSWQNPMEDKETHVNAINREKAMVMNSVKEDEDPLRGSTTSLVECLAAEGEIGRDLTTALTAVNKTLSAEDLAKLMDISAQPLEGTSSSATHEEQKSRKPSIFDGWQKKFQCSICKKGFNSDALLQKHMEKHKEDQFSCHICGNKYRFEIALLSHLKEHSQNKAVCKICSKGYKFNSSLTLHMEKSHPEAFANSVIAIKKPVGNVAAKVEQKEDQIDVSLLTEMLNQMEPDSDGKFLCPLCDRDFSRKWNLRYHILKHAEDRALWPKFDAKSGLMLHQCHECGASFQKDTGLRRHMSIMHRNGYESTTKPLAMLSSKQKPTKKIGVEISCWCDVCGKGFKLERNLKNHMGTHNRNSHGFQCPICSRVFAQKDGLNGHLWVHGGYNGVINAVGKRQKSCVLLSKHVPVEGEATVHSQAEQNESMDLTCHEKLGTSLSENEKLSDGDGEVPTDSSSK